MIKIVVTNKEIERLRHACLRLLYHPIYMYPFQKCMFNNDNLFENILQENYLHSMNQGGEHAQ